MMVPGGKTQHCDGCKMKIIDDGRHVVMFDVLWARCRRRPGMMGSVQVTFTYHALVCSQACREFVFMDPTWSGNSVPDERITRFWPCDQGYLCFEFPPRTDETPAEIPELPPDPQPEERSAPNA